MQSLCEVFFEKNDMPSNGGLLNKQVLTRQSRFGGRPEPSEKTDPGPLVKANLIPKFNVLVKNPYS